MFGPKCGALVLPLALLFSACGDVDSDDEVAPRVAGGAGPAELSLWLTADAVDGFDRILVTLTSIQFKSVDGDLLDFKLDRPLELNLLGFDRFRRRVHLLDVPVRDFEWLRLVFDRTRLFVEVDGFQRELELSDELDRQLIPLNFRLDGHRDLDLTVGLDLRQSLVDLGGDRFRLRPALRIVKTAETGSLLGTVDALLVESDLCANGIIHDRGNAIYLFKGRNAPVQDIRGDGFDPVVTTPVTADFRSERFEFQVDFLPPGDYTAVFTCDAVLDHPLRDDRIDVDFTDTFNLEINRQTESRLDIF